MRAAEAVRDGKAIAMVSRRQHRRHDGVSALLRMGRIKGVQPARPSPRRSPCPGSTPTVLLDAGANAECQAEWLVQFAQMGAVFARERYGIAAPRVGLLSIGEEAPRAPAGEGDPRAARRRRPACNFVGNVEGRDIMTDDVDVVVTDGFTGNVALKTLEGGMQGPRRHGVRGVRRRPTRPRPPPTCCCPALLPLYADARPRHHGGAMLLGVDGVCIISHGSSSARAIVNAVRVASEMVEADIVGRLTAAVAPG